MRTAGKQISQIVNARYPDCQAKFTHLEDLLWIRSRYHSRNQALISLIGAEAVFRGVTDADANLAFYGAGGGHWRSYESIVREQYRKTPRARLDQALKRHGVLLVANLKSGQCGRRGGDSATVKCILLAHNDAFARRWQYFDPDLSLRQAARAWMTFIRQIPGATDVYEDRSPIRIRFERDFLTNTGHQYRATAVPLNFLMPALGDASSRYLPRPGEPRIGRHAMRMLGCGHWLDDDDRQPRPERVITGIARC